MAGTQESQGIIALLLSPSIAPFFLAALVYTIIKIVDRTDIPKVCLNRCKKSFYLHGGFKICLSQTLTFISLRLDKESS